MKTNTNVKTNSIITQLFILCVGVMFSTSLLAEAGSSIFTYGKVDLRQANGTVTTMQRGTSFDMGDAILTGVNGRAQLRMLDGAIFDLKPNTEFLIEEYVFSGARSTTGQNINAQQDKSFYRLLRGGFRSISGLIGKRNKKNYRVKTPVATIGIRGTDYSADYCDATCASLGGTAGLYLSVASGGVVLSNDGGTLDIDPGQAGFAASQSSAPVLAGGSTVGAENSEDAADPLVTKTASDDSGNVISLESGSDLPEQAVQTSTPGQVAISINGVTAQSPVGGANIVTTGRDSLGEFSTGDTTYNLGSSSITNQGFDAQTGLFWGRWSNGTAVASNAAGSSNVDLNSSSAHWVYTTNQVTPNLPLTGTANFDLIGNTNPTDNAGNSGTLGSASLSADFTNQTVDADVNLSINSQTWDASATDVALDGEAATFAGDFDTVTITDEASSTVTNGDGTLDGFLTSDDAGNLEGAGMTYSLTDNADTTVDGAVAFEVVE